MSMNEIKIENLNKELDNFRKKIEQIEGQVQELKAISYNLVLPELHHAYKMNNDEIFICYGIEKNRDKSEDELIVYMAKSCGRGRFAFYKGVSSADCQIDLYAVKDMGELGVVSSHGEVFQDDENSTYYKNAAETIESVEAKRWTNK